MVFLCLWGVYMEFFVRDIDYDIQRSRCNWHLRSFSFFSLLVDIYILGNTCHLFVGMNMEQSEHCGSKEQCI